tara:strand:- start:245 stop:1003 length:759 start_codon:yes stop_codon:yes gene_type:complete
MINQEPDFGSLMPDTFVDLGDTSYGAAIDDYQAQMDDFDLKGPNAQFISSNASYDEEGSQGGANLGPALEAALEENECLTALVLPKDLDGVASWFHQATSFRPDYGPPPGNPYPTCTKIISSSFSVRWITGIQVEFKRFNVNPPITSCAATGNIGIAIDTQLRNPPVGIPISWGFTAGYSTATQNIALNQTYYVWAAGVSLNENSYTEPYAYMGSFHISATGEISRTINTTVSVAENEELPCGVTQPVPEPE